MKLYANLHLHSTHSDGVYTPTELAQLCYEEGYKAAALTDHDAVSGNKEFMEACKALGLESLFGIEFSAMTNLFKNPKNGKPGFFQGSLQADVREAKAFFAGFGFIIS